MKSATLKLLAYEYTVYLLSPRLRNGKNRRWYNKITYWPFRLLTKWMWMSAAGRTVAKKYYKEYGRHLRH